MPDPTAPATGTARYVIGWGLLLLVLLLLGIALGASAIQQWWPSLARSWGLGAGDAQTTSGDVVFSAVLSLVLMGAAPLAWGALTRASPWAGTWRFFGFDAPVARGLGMGAAWGILCVLGSFLLAAIAIGTHLVPAGNPELCKLLQALDARTAVLVALSAGIGEEILFRGLLQRRLGIYATAVLFGITHLGYGTVLQVIVPFGVGIVFGHARKRYGLWAAIAAHTTFDLVQLLIGLGAKAHCDTT